MVVIAHTVYHIVLACMQCEDEISILIIMDVHTVSVYNIGILILLTSHSNYVPIVGFTLSHQQLCG